jgi:hypothetical protein
VAQTARFYNGGTKKIAKLNVQNYGGGGSAGARSDKQKS